MKRFALIFALFFLAVGALFFTIRPKRVVLSWMEAQIKEDLNLYQSTDLRSENLKAYFHQAPPSQLLVFCQIKDNKVYWKKNWESNQSIDRVRKTVKILHYMTKNRKLPNVEFIFTVHDGFNTNQNESDPAPLFCYAKREGAPGILIPDPLSEEFSRRSRKKIEKANRKPSYAWENKKEVAFWRGGTTGPAPYLIDNWYQQPRSQLTFLTKYYPDLIDSGFASFPNVEEKVKAEIERSAPQVDWIVHKDHLKYKYLVIPDGNTCTYPRYYLGLASNSVVFKQESDQIQWFYKALKPYTHYIPVDYYFSNLPEQVEWAKQNDPMVKMVSKNAREFVRHNLLPKQIYDYMETLLIEYAQLQQESEIILLEGAQPYHNFKEGPL